MTDHDEPTVPLGDGGLVRVRLDLGYDGTDFSGWAVQPGRRSVQGVLEEALATILRLDQLRLVVAGRTDAGVHATGQVAHCDVPGPVWAAERDRLVRRLAGLLPDDVRVYSAAEISPDFDARFGALYRRYRYRIDDSDSGPQPLRRHDTAGWKHSLDADLMAEAAERLLGLHDFVAFCRRREGASTVRQLQQLQVTRTGSLVELSVRADAFCHSMVRSLVGALAAVGDGRRPVGWPGELLTLGHRSERVTVAPARGLTLLEVAYPPASEWAARAAETRTVRVLA